MIKEFKNVKVGYIPDAEVEINNKKYLIHGVNCLVEFLTERIVAGTGLDDDEAAVAEALGVPVGAGHHGGHAADRARTNDGLDDLGDVLLCVALGETVSHCVQDVADGEIGRRGDLGFRLQFTFCHSSGFLFVVVSIHASRILPVSTYSTSLLISQIIGSMS